MAYNLSSPLGLIMKIFVLMSEICARSLTDLIHCHGSTSSLLIADRHRDNRLNDKVSFAPLLFYTFVSAGCELQCGINWRDRQSAKN